MSGRGWLLAAAWTLSAGVPGAAGAVIYARVPRALSHPFDLALLAVVVASTLWGFALSAWLVLRMNRAHDAIIDLVSRVDAGRVQARATGRSAPRRADELERAIDAMIAAIDRLTTSQRHLIPHAAHELRHPVRALLDELMVLRRSEAVDEDALTRADESARRLDLHAADLLAVDRIGTSLGVAPLLSLREVALAALEPMRAEARARGVALGVDGDGRARGRATDLQRLVHHLLENAVRHSPSGAPVRVIIRDDPPFVTLRVRDQGPGVAAEVRARVFEPFACVGDPSAADDPGAGLGLSIVREIARSHGGDATLEPPDPARRGATFAVRLPRG